MILGLTGGIASGKSTVSKILKNMGFKIYDADIIAKKISEREDIQNKIIKELQMYKEDILNENKINRKTLRNLAFKNKKVIETLNNIIHPEVIEYFKKIMKIYENSDEIIIFDIPLLFETKLDSLCDKVLLIVTDEENQIKRIMDRDKIDRDLAIKIIDSQMKTKEKKLKSDYIVENNKTLEDLENQIKRIIEEIL